MKKLHFFLFFAFLALAPASSQILDPVSWSTEVKKVSDTEYDLISRAAIEKNWHLYSQEVPEDGPIPTAFTFETGPGFERIGDVTESEGVSEYDQVFDMVITSFENSATFTQRI